MEFIFFLALFFTFFTYLGFDITLFLLAKIFPKYHKISNSYEPHITVMIPVRNEEFTVEQKIKNLLEIDYPKDKIQILVIDSQSTDKTFQIVSSFGSLVEIQIVPHNGKAGAMILGINQFATGDIIISTDANAYFKNNTIREIVKNFSDESIGGVTGAMMQEDLSDTDASQNSSLYWEIERLRRINESKFHSCISMSGEISCFRTSIVKNQNWYKKGDPDDFDLTLFIIQKGYRVIYEKNAYVWEKAPDNFADIEKQKVRIIVQTITSLIHHPYMLLKGRYGFILFSHKFLPLASPLFLLILYFSNLMLLSFSHFWFFKFFFFSQTFFYISYFLNISFSFLKVSNYVIFLNILVLKSFYLYLRGNDFTKWDKIMSSRK